MSDDTMYSYDESLPSSSIFVQHVIDDDEKSSAAIMQPSSSSLLSKTIMRTSFDNNKMHKAISSDAMPQTFAATTVLKSSFRKSIEIANNSISTPDAASSSISNIGRNDGSKSTGGTSISPRPFLKRGSRIEPSALNRIAKEKANVSATTSSNYKNYDSNSGNRKSYSNNSTLKATGNTLRYSNDKVTAALSLNRDFNIENEGGVDKDDVLLEGSDYWHPPRHPSSRNSNQVNESTLRRSTLHAPIGDYSLSVDKIQTRAMEELDEFAMIEKELDDMVSPHRKQQSQNNHSSGNSSNSNSNSNSNTRHYNHQIPISEVNLNGDYDDDGDYLNQYQSYTKQHALKSSPVTDSQEYCIDKEKTIGSIHSNNTDDHDDDDDDDDYDDDCDDPCDEYDRYNSAVKVDVSNKEAEQVDYQHLNSSSGTRRGVAHNSWGAASRPSPGTYNYNPYAEQATSNHSNNTAIASTHNNNNHKIVRNNNSDNVTSMLAQQEQVTRTRPLVVKKKSQPNSYGNNRNNSTTTNTTTTTTNSDMNATAFQESLKIKARELESELITYKQENANLKQLKRQQETTLTEVYRQRDELLKWMADEKKKTESWCEEQRQYAMRERRSASKHARDIRDQAAGLAGPTGSSSNGGIPLTRRERAEVEALKATIEKMKLDHDQATKRWKLGDKRLNQLAKDNSQQIDDLQKSIFTLENEKVAIWTYLESQASLLKIPSSILKYRPKKLGGTLSSTSNYSSSHRPSAASTATSSAVPAAVYRDKSYCEEVDVVELSTNTRSSNKPSGSNSNSDSRKDNQYDLHTESNSVHSSYSMTDQKGGALANEIFSHYNSGGYDSYEHDDEVDADAQVAEEYGLMNDELRSSLARSSRASTRYSDDDATAYEDNASNIVKEVNSKRATSSSSFLTASSDYGNATVNLKSIHMPLLSPSKATTTTAAIAAATSTSTTGSSAFSCLYLDDIGSNTVNGSNHGSSRSNFKSISTTTTHATASNATASTTPGNSGNSRTEETMPDGTKIIRYRNGTIKEVLIDGTSIVRFTNGDTKRTSADTGIVVYFYADAKTIHTTYADGLEVYEFPNKQVEKHYPNGMKEIVFPDTTKKVIRIDGIQESSFPDGVVVKDYPDGSKEIVTPDGVSQFVR